MRTGSGMAGLAEKVCLGASSLAMVAFSGPHDIVILFRILAGGWGADATDGRTLGDEILNRVVLAAALFPALWLAGRASARMMGRRMPAEKGRLARLDAISWLPFVLLFAPFFPLWGARDLDGFLPPMLHLFLGVAACVLGGKASLWAVARMNGSERPRVARATLVALALAVGWAVFLKLAGPARYMLAPWDEGYVENGWPRGAFVFVHAATIFLGAGFLFGATWVLVLRWGEGREWVASLVVVAVSGALVWGSLAHLARAQHAYDDQVLTRWAIEEGRAGVEIGGAGEWALVTTGGRLTFGAVGESGRVVGDLCEGSVEPCRRIDLGFRLAEGEKRPVQVLLGVAPEASLWYRRGGEFAFLLGEAEEAGRKGSPASRVRLDPRWRPEDRRWETVDLEMEAGRRYVLLVSAPPGAPLAAVAFHPGE